MNNSEILKITPVLLRADCSLQMTYERLKGLYILKNLQSSL